MKDRHKMGNYIFGNKKRITVYPPVDLNTLLTEITEDDEDVWIKRFRQHLKKIERSDLEAMLDFVIKFRTIEATMNRNKLQRSRPVKQEHKQHPHQHQQSKNPPLDAREIRLQLLTEIGFDYFSEDSPKLIQLTNQELQNDLCQKLSGLAKARDEKLIRDAFDLLKMASKDNKVWKGGLDTAYNRFKAIYDSNNKVANVILSIL